MNKCIIIGAGISGLSLAWKLAERGIQTVILEKEGYTGGLAATLRDNGYCMDFGPHSFFSPDDALINTVMGVLKNSPAPSPRQVKFYYKGRYMDYPLTARNVLFQMGWLNGILSAVSFAKEHLKKSSAHPEEETVESWAVTNFGRRMYNTFFKPYTEQFWKEKCTLLSADAIPAHTRMSFTNTCRLVLHRYTTGNGSSLIEREMLPVYYPDTGFGEIAEGVAEKVRRAGGIIHTGAEVCRIDAAKNNEVTVYYKQDGDEKNITGSMLVSTIPLNLAVEMITPQAPEDVMSSARQLDYLALIVLGMAVDKKNILKCSYIYHLNRPYNRISEMNKFSPATSPAGENIFTVEISCIRGSSIWQKDSNALFDMSIDSIEKDGFIRRKEIKKLILLKAPYAYPIYRKGYKTHLKNVLKYIAGFKQVDILGRTGEFMYMDIDECMKRAFAFADKIPAAV